MNQYLITSNRLKGTITIPPSKSQTLRAILFASFGHGKSIIDNYLPSPDTQAMIEACRLFGARVALSQRRIEIDGINGKVHTTEDVIHAANSGIVLRFCAAIGALACHPVVITGDYSIRHQRPIKPLLEAIEQLGVKAISMRGDHYAPVIIQGPLKPGKVVIDGQDSQPVSALLIASAFATGPIDISVYNAGEKPWVALTLSWFDRLGIPYENQAFERYRIFGKGQYEAFHYTVPGDLSSAAFPIAAALITQSELTLTNVDMNDPQGDKKVIAILERMGAIIKIDEEKNTLLIMKSPQLVGITIDINDMIDAITILAVMGCYAEGETLLYNGAIARHKECNRIQAIVTELKKMGADIEETADGLRVKRSHLRGAAVNTYNDHRVAMSLSVAALGAEGETTISPVNCIEKTFPTFLEDFNHLGANIIAKA